MDIEDRKLNIVGGLSQRMIKAAGLDCKVILTKSLDEAIDLIKQNTRKYAKRQFTWFNNQMKDINWFNVDYNNFDNTINEVKNFIMKNT